MFNCIYSIVSYDCHKHSSNCLTICSKVGRCINNKLSTQCLNTLEYYKLQKNYAAHSSRSKYRKTGFHKDPCGDHICFYHHRYYSSQFATTLLKLVDYNLIIIPCTHYFSWLKILISFRNSQRT